jgi:hypothetical protein
VVETTTPLVVETTTPLIIETTTPLVVETTTPVVVETTTPLIETTPAFTTQIPCELTEVPILKDVSSIKPSSSPETVGNLLPGVGSAEKPWTPTDSKPSLTVTLPEVNGKQPNEYPLMAVDFKSVGPLPTVTVTVLDENGKIVFEGKFTDTPISIQPPVSGTTLVITFDAPVPIYGLTVLACVPLVTTLPPSETTKPVVGTTTPVVVETTTPVVIETTTPIVVETTTPGVVETTTPVVVETTTPVVIETTTPVVVETTTPVVVETTTPVLL